MKSFLSLERSATFTCRKNGIERKYLVYEGDEFVNFDLIHQKDTLEDNGVIAEISIKDFTEKNLFVDKAKAKLAYYDTVVLVVDGNIIKNDIHRNELFQYSSLNKNSYIHIALKDVYYTIDYEALGIAPVNLPVAIRLGLGDGLTPTPSRESYITNDKVRNMLLERIKDIAEWFVKRYNATVTEFPTFLDAFEYLGNNQFQVPLEGKTFHINPILGHSKIKVLEPKIKGITLRNGTWYKAKHRHLLQEYSACGFTFQDGTSTSKEHNIPKDKNIFELKRKAILVGQGYVGNVKNYLKNKYGTEQIYVRNNHFTRRLGGRVNNRKCSDNGTTPPDSYFNVLDLNQFPKEKWRALIQEWQLVVSTITSTFKDETQIIYSKEYTDWLEAKKANQKVLKASGYIGGSYTGLNKQQGDITMAYAYERYGKIHFKKEVYPIANLTDNHFLTVVVDPEEAEEAKPFAIATLNPNVRFAVVGKLERRKIPSFNQFTTFKQYLTMSSKPFIRLASSILFRRAVEEYQELSEHKNGVFRMVVKSFVDDVNALDEYQKKNYVAGTKDEVESAILQVAEEHKLFDQSLWDVYQRVRANLTKYDFVNLLEEPDYYDTETKKRYDALVNQVLLFRKMKYDDLDGAQIVFKTGKIQD